MPARLISLDYLVPDCDTNLVKFPVLIGRAAESQIRLDDYSISNHHCEIDYEGDGLVVRDLGSVHGTFVNATRVAESRLMPGDELAVGMMTFLVLGDPEPKPETQVVELRGERQRRHEGVPVLAAT